MAKKLNKKLVGVLVVLMMVLMTALGVLLLANMPGQDPEKYAEDAAKFRDQGEYKQAMQAYVRAFQKDPAENPEYLVKAAECAIDKGDLPKARQYIGHAKVKDPQLASALQLGLSLEFEIAQLYSNAAQWHRVLDLAQQMLSTEAKQESALAHFALGKAYLALRSEDSTYKDKGEAALKRAHELDPADVEIVKSLTEELWRSASALKKKVEPKKYEEMVQARNSMIASAIEQSKKTGDQKDLTEFERLQARYLILDGKTEKGLSQLEQLAAKETDQAESHLLLGMVYQGRGIRGIKRDLDRAATYLEEGLKIDPKNAKLYVELARVYQLQRSKLKDPAEIEAKAKEEEQLYEQGLAQIERSKHFRKLNDNNARVSFIEGLFLHELKHALDAKDKPDKDSAFAAAEGWIDKLKEEQSVESYSVKVLTARYYFAKGDLIDATRNAEAAKRLAGSSPQLSLEKLLTDLYMSQKQWGAARDSLGRALKMSPREMPLYVAMGEVLLNMKRPTDALRYLKPTRPTSLREALGNNPRAIKLCIDAYRQLNQFELAEAENRRLGGSSPIDELRSATILSWQKRYDEAEKIIKSVLKAHPNSRPALRAILTLYEKTNRRDMARTMIQKLLAEHPNDRTYQRYNLYFMEKKEGVDRNEQVRKFLEEESDDYTRFITLAEFYYSQKQFDKAKSYLDKAEKLRPDDGTVIERQFSVALQTHDWARASQYAQRHGELDVDGTQGKVAEGRLALAKGESAKNEGKLDEANTMFEQAIDQLKVGVQNYPSYSLGWTYLAQAYMAAGRINDAKKELLQALKINPANGYANKSLANIAAVEKDEKTEKRYLKEAEKALPNDPWVRRRQQYYQDRQNPKKGIARREKLMREKPDDFQNLVLLARLYADEKIGDTDKATETYLKALKLSHNDLSLAREVAVYFGSEQVNLPSKGEKLLNDLLREEKSIPKKAEIAASLGHFYESQNVLATADRHYRMAVSLDPSPKILSIAAEFYSRTGRLKDALEYFDRALKKAADDPGLAQQIQSRMIAIDLALGDLDHAREKIDLYRTQYPNDPQGMIYEGAYHRMGGDIEKAKQAFNKQLERDPDNAVALWQRGQLYLLMGQWELAIDDLKKAKTFSPDGFKYQHRIALSKALLEAGRGSEAINELKQILESSPEELGVVRSLVETYFHVRPAQFTDAESLIYRYMRRYPRDYQWPALLGRLGELSGDWNKAIAGYTKAAEVGKNRPDTIRALFSAYRKNNRPQDVIQYASEKIPEKLLSRIPEALSILAWAYQRTGSMERCYQTFDRAFAATKDNFSAYTRVIGEMVRVLGNKASLERAQKMSEADPENVDKQRALVHLYKMNDKPEQAIAACRRIEQLSSRDTDQKFAHMAKGMLLASLKRYPEAKAEYETVLKLDPAQSMTLNNLAYVLAENLNRPSEALPYARQASRLQPNDPNVLDTYGWILSLNQRPGEAAGALMRALGIDSENIDAMYHLGMVYLKQGALEESKFRLEKAKSLAEAEGRPDYLPKITKALEDLKSAGG